MAYLDLSQRTVYKMLRDGVLQAERIGHQWAIYKKPFFDRFGWPDDEIGTTESPSTSDSAS